MADETKVKSTWFSTEFISTIIVQIVGLLAFLGLFTPEQCDLLTQGLTQAAGGILMGLAAFGYATGRGNVKTNMPVSTIKPGIKTTEFWVSLVAKLAGIAGAIGVVPAIATSGAGVPIVQASGIITTILGVLGYNSARSKAKSNGG